MSQSKKTLEFLQKLKDSGHWNEDYDYSEVDYISTNKKIILIDKEYNSKHEIIPKILLNGTRCTITNCLSPRDYAIKQFRMIHGDKYDYSKFNYINSKSKSIIICPIHGEFLQEHSSHRQGVGCEKCGRLKTLNSLTFEQENVINKIKQIHGDKYDYSKVAYNKSTGKVIIIDKEYNTEHLIAPNKIFTKKTECTIQNAVNPSDYFIKRAVLIHGNKFDYSKLSYVDNKKDIIIICPEHGKFNTKPSLHLNKNGGCNKCSNNQVKTKEELIKLFSEKHGNKYDYSLLKNINKSNDLIDIICHKHGIFQQRLTSHISGRGCYICGKGWNNENIINFINDIRNEDVLNMDSVELNMLIAQGKLPEEFDELVFTLEGTKENSLKTLKEKLGIEDSHELSDSELENLSDKLESMTMSSYDDEINDALVAIETISDEDYEFSRQEERKRQGLPSISNEDILVLDKELINTCDEEAVEFFIQYKLKRVWNEIINDKRDVKDIRDLNGGKNSSRLRDLFLSEYKKVVEYNPPTGYNFKRNGEIALPNMMQKLTVQRVIDYKRYGNWSGTGAGKTISFIIASREVNSRLTIVICINSTVSQLEEDILDVYPDSKIFTHFRKGQKFNRDNHNYLLLNYEKFQQGYTEEIFQDLNENNLIDFIVLDEVHNAKQRDKDESIRRGALMRLIGRSAEMNPNFHLLGMSATPVINNLIEAKSLLQLITGKDYDDISTRGTITNALKIFNQLLLNGIRYIPKYDIVLKELTAENTTSLNIDGTKLTEKLKDNDNKDYLGLEKILLESKLEVLEEFLKPKTIIYTYFTDNDRIPKRIAKYVKSKGYSCGIYIGEQSTEEREYSKTSFVKGDVDILIASRIIGTGVDGLQNVCNRMILLTLPWTDSEYTQLKGRIYRQGSKFGDVEIVIPQVFVDLDDKRWSWDKQRLQLIREKRTLADAAVDGIIPSKHIPSRERLCSDSLQALKIWKDRVSEGKITTIERNDLVLPLRPEILEYLKPSLGDFSEMNKSWSVSRSENTKNRLIKDPSEWYYYHSLYAEKRKEWSEIPYIEIAKKIKERPEWIVADMGCGENLLSKELTNQVHAFDYVAIDKNVTACDMSSVPLNSQEVDAVVFCLSLMGSNYLDYLKEAFRIIKPYGNLFICEPKKKIDNRIEDFKKDIESVGFKIIEVNSQSSKFIYFQGIKL
jgi:superfamily II DNA or RNA helicase